jgi:hypothetical protein
MAYALRMYLCFCIVIFLTYSPKAQSYLGFGAGLSLDYLRSNKQDMASDPLKPSIGYQMAFRYQYKINHWLVLEADPQLLQKKYGTYRTDFFSGVYEKHINTYTQLPILADVIYGKRLQIFLSGGIFGAYWIRAWIKGKIPNIFSASVGQGQTGQSYQLTSYSQKYTFNPAIDRRLESGWVAGGGLKYRIHDTYSFIIDFQYFQSLTPIQRQYELSQTLQYNRSPAVLFGCDMLLHKRKKRV